MSIGEHLTQKEVAIWADMVATHHLLTGRNPDDDEVLSITEAARALAAEQGGRKSPVKGANYRADNLSTRQLRRSQLNGLNVIANGTPRCR